MFDVPGHHKWLTEDELIIYYLDFVFTIDRDEV